MKLFQDRLILSKNITFERKGPTGEIFKFLYNVDSLQDSLRVKEIDSACRIAFDKEGLNVPISISEMKMLTAWDRMPPEDMRVPIKSRSDLPILLLMN